MFSFIKPFLVIITTISFLMIVGNSLSLLTDVSGSVSISRQNMASQQSLLLSDTLLPSARVDNKINNDNNNGIKNDSVDKVNSVQSKTVENGITDTILNQTDMNKSARLSVKIITPVQNSTYVSKEITVNGNAFSSGNDFNNHIRKVEVSYHDNTYNKTYPYRLTEPFLSQNWTHWSIKLNFNVTGYYRILARVTNEAGNQEWDSVTIHIPILIEPNTGDSNKLDHYATNNNRIDYNNTKVAFVQNTFTEAAYSPHGFYSFYDKYNNLTSKKTPILSDLDMLRTQVPSESSTTPISILTKTLKNIAPDSMLINIIDQDVDEGRIFSNYNGRNVYSILILFHEEYVTQKMYDNFRRFVNNGGTIIFMDGNFFIAEVNYNEQDNTVTLVKGHAWEYDGKSARKSIAERWFNETKGWVGSNFVNRAISSDIYHLNNPFNYTHFEDNYVNNPHAVILLDYQARFPHDKVYSNDTKIATYALGGNGKGKVIVLGIYAENILKNTEFRKFLINELFPYALSSNSSRTPWIKITTPVDNSLQNNTSNITVQGSALGGTNIDGINQLDIKVQLDNGTYHNLVPKKFGAWFKWSLSLDHLSLGSHKVIAKVTDSDGKINWDSVRFSTVTLDKFGVKKIYLTKQGGREWYVNMENPHKNQELILENIGLQKQSDGSWWLGSTDRNGIFNGKYHIVMGVNTPRGQEEWQNVEITGYVKVIATSSPHNILQWYARGANHTSSAPCEGTSLKGRIHVNGEAGWVKEIWHDGGYTDENATTNTTSTPIIGRWIGWKVIIYNISDNKAVKMLSYIDDKNNNQWRKVTDFTDSGKWYSSSPNNIFYSAHCGYPKDYVVTNSGPVASFRSDGIVWQFKNLSVREIQPPS